MEAQTELQTYLEQGRTALAQGHPRDAAIAYAHGAQIEPENPTVHLGLAEANLALGNYGVVQMACRKVFELQPETGIEARIAQALLDLLERRYERALQNVDTIVRDDPANAYVHALRSYLLRATGQDYDANLARARATRLSYGGRFENSFPALEPSPEPKINTTATATTPAQNGEAHNNNGRRATRERETVPTWSRPNPMRRQIIRTRYLFSQRPGLLTNILIGVYLVVFALLALFDSEGQITGQVYQIVPAILQGEVWRLVTGIFVTLNFLNLAMILLSLFFVGRAVEMFYGPVRYLAIFFASGIIGGIVPLAFHLDLGLGPSGALMGIFGALGAFYIANRRVLGVSGSSAILNWVFWLVLILVFNISSGGMLLLSLNLALLVITMIVSFLLLPRSGNRNSLF